MAIEQIQHQIKASIWQSVAQSGVDLSAIPPDEQDKLVSQIADGVMVSVNELLDQSDGINRGQEEVDEHGEHVLWEGRPFLSVVEYYVLTNDRLKIRQGLLGREIENYELIRIQDIDLQQGAVERVFGIGDINIHGQDPSNPKVELRNVSEPEAVYETLRRAWLDARKRHGLQFSEFM
ncbi:MAG: PH domain-containing protein [Anaerolineales bacterium]|nr:PH domain-containing protein [Anaerolineales bacterium]